MAAIHVLRETKSLWHRTARSGSSVAPLAPQRSIDTNVTLHVTPRQTPRHFMPLRDRLRDTPRHSITDSETLRDTSHKLHRQTSSMKHRRQPWTMVSMYYRASTPKINVNDTLPNPVFNADSDYASGGGRIEDVLIVCGSDYHRHKISTCHVPGNTTSYSCLLR